MFIVGFDIDTRAYFTFATSIIAIPTGIKISNWFVTLWSGCFFSITPLFFVVGFLFPFPFGGFTGVILANCIIDTILHDTYFVVGHFHYVLSLGAVYTFFGAFYNYWIPIGNNASYNDILGRIHFSISSISSNLIFFTMHSLGILGFPRRILDYPVIYIRFHWLNGFGLVGIAISLFTFICSLFNRIFIYCSIFYLLFDSSSFVVLFLNNIMLAIIERSNL